RNAKDNLQIATKNFMEFVEWSAKKHQESFPIFDPQGPTFEGFPAFDGNKMKKFITWVAEENKTQIPATHGIERGAQILSTPQAEEPTGIILLAKAPGMPTDKEGFKPPKNWDGKLVKTSKGYGYPDNKGNVWVPTGLGGSLPGTTGPAHGGPHWDVQNPTGKHTNVYPAGGKR
ncbi:hypothetical protein AWC38_SpisGene25499, partial [Stylophora pistillata]